MFFSLPSAFLGAQTETARWITASKTPTKMESRTRTTTILMGMKFQLPIKEIDLGTASQDLLITAELAFYRLYLSENPDELVVGTRKHAFS